jgi:hypothetical protein
VNRLFDINNLSNLLRRERCKKIINLAMRMNTMEKIIKTWFKWMNHRTVNTKVKAIEVKKAKTLKNILRAVRTIRNIQQALNRRSSRKNKCKQGDGSGRIQLLKE